MSYSLRALCQPSLAVVLAAVPTAGSFTTTSTLTAFTKRLKEILEVTHILLQNSFTGFGVTVLQGANWMTVSRSPRFSDDAPYCTAILLQVM